MGGNRIDNNLPTRSMNRTGHTTFIVTKLPIPENWFRRQVRHGPEKGGEMPRKKHTPEQVINKLREAEVAISGGRTAAEAGRQIGVTEQTIYRWRNEYGGLRIDQVKRPNGNTLKPSSLAYWKISACPPVRLITATAASKPSSSRSGLASAPDTAAGRHRRHGHW